MKIPTYYLICTIPFIVVSLGFGFYEYRTAKTTSLIVKMDQLEIDQLQHRLVGAQLSRRSGHTLESQGMVSDQRASGSEANSTHSTTRMVHISDIIKDHPEFGAIDAKETRRKIIQQYLPLLARLNLSPAQLQRAKDLLAERSLSVSDAQQAAAESGVPSESAEWNVAVNQSIQGIVQELNTILATSSTSLSKLDALSSSLASVNNHYVPDFVDAGISLNDDQVQVIAQAMTSASPRAGATGQVNPNYNTPDPTTGLTPKESQILSQVSSNLSPAQLQLFQADLVQNTQRQLIMSQYTKGGGSTIIAP
jgi:hypothetical protein